MKFIQTLLVLFVAVSACTQTTAKVEGESFGAGITSSDYIDFDALIDQLGKNDTVNTTIRATVSEVCQAKGCWMTLSSSTVGSTTEVMVRFKDYGFFVPKDISGRSVVVQGQAYKTIVPVDELRHYAEDAGKSKEEIAKITEPEESFAFLASGVVVMNQ